MPELPEVETLKLYLEPNIVGKVINKIIKNRDNLRYRLQAELSIGSLGKILGLRRRAKYLIIDLDNKNSLVVHLGMSGRLTLQPQNYILQKHDHIIIHLDDNQQLVFTDPRRFGMVYLFPKDNLWQQKIFEKLAPEPLTNMFNLEYLKSKLDNKELPIKNAIMNNNIIVGVGNIYASESLFMAKIHPCSPSKKLTELEINQLVCAIKKVLTDAIKAGGTTLKDFVSGDSKPGYFQQKLLVYNRDEQECFDCGNVIKKIVQSGRSGYFCPNCQII